ncbi:hypothetical protein [Pedobacter sp.]|uniref:hypothetical protein n=1 Tax=Pedobacter sp. TaxID=1411316 RepID=UPI003C3B6C4C
MEDKRVDEFAEMADKRPRKAIIYLMGLLIVGLLAFAKYQDSKLSSAQDHEEEALAAQADKYQKEIDKKDTLLAAAEKKIDNCRDQVVSRTDMFVDKITQGYQKQIDEAKKIERERAKLYRERSDYIKKDKINLHELNKVTRKEDEE